MFFEIAKEGTEDDAWEDLRYQKKDFSICEQRKGKLE